MLQVISETLWIFLPAIVANMAPVFAAKYGWIESLNKPLDGGLKWREKPILGRNKTIRGLVIGIIFGSVTAGIQHYLYVFNWAYEISLASYDSLTYSLLLGFLLGTGALFGDSIKSFFKRQLNVMPGNSWPVFDQIDFIAGAIVAIWWLVPLSLIHAALALLIIGIGSFLVSVLGVNLKIKKTI